jgi:hypothetical protein
LPDEGMDGLEAFELQLDGLGGVGGAHGISVNGGYGRDGERHRLRWGWPGDMSPTAGQE